MDKPLCGFELADGTPCREERTGRWCTEHNGIAYALCAGCGVPAMRACPQRFCGAPLCADCGHDFADGHSRMPKPMEPPASSNPAGPPPPELAALRAELLSVASRSVIGARDEGMIGFVRPDAADAVATKLLNDLSTHVLLKVLSAIGGQL